MLTRLVLRTWLPQALWAIGTPLEPLVSLRRRIELTPADGEITHEAAWQMDAHIGAYARELAEWTAAGMTGLAVMFVVVPASAILTVALSAGMSGAPPRAAAGAAAATFEMALLLTLVSLFAWSIWLVRIAKRFMADPVDRQCDRTVLALKKRALGQQAMDVLRSLPTDSALRLYLGKLVA